jgi:hypothetical protein|tara:strand:+ start:4585 stop:5157 length:573 start_codon:yes stop_codon:yes gene_type:complete
MKKFKSLREAAASDHVTKKNNDNNMSTNDIEFVDLHAVEVTDHPVATEAQFPNKEKKTFSGLRKVNTNEAFEKEDASDFCLAAAVAKKEGKKKFIFAGKEYPVTIKTDIAVKENVESVYDEEVEFIEEAIKVGTLKLNNGKSVKVSKEDAATLNSVLEDLNPVNRKRMEEELKKDEKSYKNMLTFAKRTD